MVLQEGKTAPNFTLPRCTGDDFENAELYELLESSNVILAFFPLAFSPVCTEELCHFRNILDQLQQLNTQVYGISLDSPLVLNEFIKKEDLNFPLFSDFNREIVDDYDIGKDEVLDVDSVPRRSILLIDQNREVRYSWSSEDPYQHPDYEELKIQSKRIS